MIWWNNKLLPATHPLQRWIVLALVVLATDAAIFASVGVSISVESLRGYYSLGITQTDWVNTSFLMMLATTVPISARLGSRYGFKRVFFWGCALFFLSSTLIAITTSYPLLLLFRMLAGAGSGILMPLCVSIIAFSFKAKELPLALSLYTAFGFGLGFALGSYLGGLFSQEHPFQYLFIVIGVVGAATLLGIALFFHETAQATITPFDFPGYITFLALIFSGLLVTMNAKAPWNSDGWYSNYSILHITAFFLSFFLFIVFESTAQHPLFFLRHFRIRAYALSGIAMFLVGALAFGSPTFFSAVLAADLGWPTIQVGSHFSVFGIAIGLSGAIVGLLSNKIGIRLPTIVGLYLIAISCFINHSFTLYSDHKDLYMILILRGAGIGFALGPITALGLSRIPKEPKLDLAKATVMLIILRQMGAAFSSNIISILIAERTAFHFTRFSETALHAFAATDAVRSKLFSRFTTEIGSNSLAGNDQSILTLQDMLMRQAKIAAFDDAFFIFGILLTVLTTILFALMLHKILLKLGIHRRIIIKLPKGSS